MLRKRRIQPWVAWLALLAMALNMVAPVVSQTLPKDASSIDVGAWCTSHGLSAQHPHAPDAAADDGGDRCGYCSLFCHSPLLSDTPQLHLPALAWASAAPTRLDRRPTPPQRPLHPQSRGPPTLTVVR